MEENGKQGSLGGEPCALARLLPPVSHGVEGVDEVLLRDFAEFLAPFCCSGDLFTLYEYSAYFLRSCRFCALLLAFFALGRLLRFFGRFGALNWRSRPTLRLFARLLLFFYLLFCFLRNFARVLW